jgi:hypothetical protein
LASNEMLKFDVSLLPDVTEKPTPALPVQTGDGGGAGTHPAGHCGTGAGWGSWPSAGVAPAAARNIATAARRATRRATLAGGVDMRLILWGWGFRRDDGGKRGQSTR